jgi:hypothetical protein
MIEYKKLMAYNTQLHVFTVNQYTNKVDKGSKIKGAITPGDQLWIPKKFYEKNGLPMLLFNGVLFNMATGQAYGENVELPEFRPVFAVNKFSNTFCQMAKSAKEINGIDYATGSIFWGTHGQLINNKGQIDIVRKADSLKAPRTFVGVKQDGRLVVVLAEGRKPPTINGISITEGAKLMLSLGCTRGAQNLDGGGSTQCYYQGKQLFVPSDGRERPLANMVTIY